MRGPCGLGEEGESPFEAPFGSIRRASMISSGNASVGRLLAAVDAVQCPEEKTFYAVNMLKMKRR